MRRLFFTRYKKTNEDKPQGSTYASYLLAESWARADEIAEIRGLGEEVVGEGSTVDTQRAKDYVMVSPIEYYLKISCESTKARRRMVVNLLHQTFFLLDLGEKSGRYIPPQTLFGDTDALHQLIHLYDQTRLTGLQSIEYLLKDLELAAPEMFINSCEKGSSV